MTISVATFVKMIATAVTEILASDNVSPYELISVFVYKKFISFGNKFTRNLFVNHMTGKLHVCVKNGLRKLLKLFASQIL